MMQSHIRTAAKSGYLPTLDGWRAIAIVMVIASHAVRGLCSSPDRFACRVDALGAHGVGVFFAISGFLITTRLIEELQQSGAISYRSFYIRRAFRILPPAVTYLAVIGICALAGWIAVSASDWFGALLFYRNYIPVDPRTGWYTGHFWSLAIEEHFYLFWPLLLGLSGIRRGPSVAFVLALAIGVWRRLDWHFHWFEHAFGLPTIYILNRTDTRLDALFYGCALALLLTRAGARERLTRALTLPLLIAGAAIVVVGVLFGTLATGVFLEAVLVPFLIVGTVLRPGSIVGRSLEWAPVRWVGRISYSLYLWQQLWAPQQLQSESTAAWQMPIGIALTFACAAASYYWLERPLIRFGHRLAPPVTEGRADLGNPASHATEAASPAA